jgi:thiol-disulfide isomerase/thioredoxin
MASPAVHAQGYEVVPWSARKPVPSLQGSDLNGRVWRLGDLRGKAVLVNFWASWCEPCRAEMPSLQSLAQRIGPEKLAVLAVNFKESGATAQRYADRAGLQLPILLDPDGLLARQWGVTVFPSTVLIAADGHVRGVLRGELDWSGQEATRLVTPLLEAQPLQR